MEEKNETVTENKSEKKEVVYTKNEKYGQDEINKLVKIYHMAQKAGDEVTVQDAYTKLYYHIEKYVYKCLCSVVEQTKMPDEVIIIDDCSQDKTSIICDEFSKKYSFIKTIHLTQNGGGE